MKLEEFCFGRSLCSMINSHGIRTMTTLSRLFYWPDSGTLEKLGSYVQIEEKERSGLKSELGLSRNSS